MDAEEIGIAAHLLGAGRMVKTDPIDPAVGLILHKKVGDRVEEGESLVEIHASNPEKAGEIRDRLAQAFSLGLSPVSSPPLVAKIV
jgi:pyrimidine-nucleoside phosphorylase